MRREQGIFANIDWALVALYGGLVVLGWLNIYAAVFDEEHRSIFDTTQRYGAQVIWISVSLFVAFIILLIDGKFYSTFAWPIYMLNMALLIVVIFLARDVSGARAWLDIGPFKLQPSEFSKSATALAMAFYLSTLGIRLEALRTKLVASAIMVLPMILILLQKDTGSALVFSAFTLVMYREGLSGNFLLFGLAVAVLFILTLLFGPGTMAIVLCVVAAGVFVFQRKKSLRNFILIGVALAVLVGVVFSVDYTFNNVLEPHQRIRISVMLGTEDDPHGAGYNVNQSKIAIGSGGLVGKGFLQGTQTKYNFVPEQATDFIFCTVGEEWGFLGSVVIIGLFTLLIVRVFFIAERQRSAFSRIYGYGVGCVFLFHLAVNIGMTIGLMPVIGIPLPFFSYGGSSLIGFTMLLFILIKLDAYRMQQLR
ncbi:MAG: rod shape-determining protein RodA [Flavobacteriales bacterium]|nr:rod shape-determining protein RodA [Flavobacteriales bacterium]